MARVKTEDVKKAYEIILNRVKEKGKISIQEAMAITGLGRQTITNIIYKIATENEVDFEIKTIHKQKYLVYRRFEEKQEEKAKEEIEKLKQERDKILSELLSNVEEVVIKYKKKVWTGKINRERIAERAYREYYDYDLKEYVERFLILKKSIFEKYEDLLKKISVKLCNTMKLDVYMTSNKDYVYFMVYRDNLMMYSNFGNIKFTEVKILAFNKKYKELIQDIIENVVEYGIFKSDYELLADYCIYIVEVDNTKEKKKEQVKEFLEEVGLWEEE